MDIRTKTGVIIRNKGKYLVGRIVFSDQLRWSDSPYDAWFTRRLEDAKKVSEKTGGTLMLFNPVAGQLRELMVQ